MAFLYTIALKCTFVEVLGVLLIEQVYCNCSITTAIIPSNSYPEFKRNETVQDIFGKNTVINDPYRELEKADSPETKKFIEDEMAITKPYLAKSPFRAELEERYRVLYDYQKYTGPFQKGERFFSYKNTGLQNQDVLFVQDSLKGEAKIFFDPNTLSKDGTIALNTEDSAFSIDGQVFAYLLSTGGSDWMTLQFKHVEQGDIYKDKVTKIKFTNLSWTHNNKGLFYSAFRGQQGKGVGSENEENKNHRVYYHVLGTEESKDVLVAEFPDNPNYMTYTAVSDCGKYLILHVAEGTENNIVYIADLAKINYEIKGKLKLISIVTRMEANYWYVASNDNKFIFITNKDADNYKLLTVDITNPDPKLWKNLVAENEKYKLEWAHAVYDKYVVLCYIEDVKSVLYLHDINTGKMIKKFDLDIGTVEEKYFFGDRRTFNIFFNFESFLTPGITYHCDLSKCSFDLEVLNEIEVKNFDREKFTVEQVFCKSKDGTKVPMYIVHKKGLEKCGKNLAFMYAYGGYGISTLPYFTVNRLVVISNFDGLHVVVTIRGGGEYGEKWHRDGMLDKKQNGFDDFQAAAEYLIAEKYTSSELIAINGASNGGILMGACLNQRPDLFGVVIISVGILDMLRFDKFTIGRAWVVEFGSPSNPDDFKYLIKYSPLHNIKLPCDPNKQYPATMLITGEQDDRVPPLHSLKFIATLQYEAKKHANQKKPFIIRVDEDAGHGKGKPTDKIIAEFVDMMCFIVLNTGVQFHPFP